MVDPVSGPARVALTLLVLLISVAVGGWMGLAARRPPTVTLPVGVGSENRTPLVVHVAGWVANPGVVTLEPGSRVAEAVAAAGGALPGARLDDLNLAEPVVDGVRVYVPGPDDEGAGGGGETSDGRIAVNRATAEELERLPGVGPVLASRIVSHREENGPFRTPEDLLAVPGIGERTLENLRSHIVVP
ncbi:MAG: competence protein ComEA [Acidimicrobiia bacterium]|nr:MAG: competence protein ComEA [Acidimicrobiia bacterium]